MAKIGQVYNLQSFDNSKNYFQSLDTAGGIVLGRNLEHVSSEIFEQKIAGLSFLSQSGITINNEGGYVSAVTKLKTNVQGDFKDSGDNTNGNGKISVGGESDTIPVFSKEANSDWSEIDLQKASLENRNLLAEFLKGHDTKYKENIDSIGFLGNGTKTNGLLNSTLWTSTSATGTFDSLSAEDIYKEISELVTSQRNNVLNDEVFSCDKVVLHPETLNLISKTFYTVGGFGLTTLKSALETTLNITFVPTPKAKIDGVKRMVAYSSDRQAMQMRLPVPLQISNTSNHGFRYYIESYFSIAGLDVIERDSARVLTGV